MGKKPTREDGNRGMAGAADELRTAAFMVCRSVRTLEDVAARAEVSTAAQFEPTFRDLEDARGRIGDLLTRWGR